MHLLPVRSFVSKSSYVLIRKFGSRKLSLGDTAASMPVSEITEMVAVVVEANTIVNHGFVNCLLEVSCQTTGLRRRNRPSSASQDPVRASSTVELFDQLNIPKFKPKNIPR